MSEESPEFEQSRPLPKLPVQWLKNRLCLHVIKEILEITNKLKSWPKKDVISLVGENSSSFDNFLELLEEITLSSSNDILIDSTRDLKEQLEEICIEVDILDLAQLKLLRNKLIDCRKKEETSSRFSLNMITPSTSSMTKSLETTNGNLNNKACSIITYKEDGGSYFIKSNPVQDPDFLIELRLFNLKEISPDVLYTKDMWKESQRYLKFFGRTNVEGELIQYFQNAFPLAKNLIKTKQKEMQTMHNKSEPKIPSLQKKSSKQKPHTSRKPY